MRTRLFVLSLLGAAALWVFVVPDIVKCRCHIKWIDGSPYFVCC